MPHPLGFAVLCGLLSAVLFVSLLLGLPGMLLVYFAQLPVLFAGLTLGLSASAIAVVGADRGDRADAEHGGGARLRPAARAAGPVHGPPGAAVARTDQGKTEWFPAGLLLTQLTLLAGPA